MSLDQLLSDDSSTLDFPTIRPTLDLNFARTKTLDPRITFTRSSGGSYVGPDGIIKYAGVNQPRFDHDPTTGESLGLLIEESRANLIKSSENFTISAGFWTLGDSGAIATNQAIAPDGAQTADKLYIDNTSYTNKFIQSNIYTTIGNQTYTVSVFLKAERHSFARVEFQGGGNTQFVVVNLLNGTVINTSVVNNTYQYSITPYPNGWYRVSVSSIGASSSVAYALRIYLVSSAGSTPFIGTSGNGVYIWGAQLEEGAFPTSYIPTVASTRTRAVDNATITGTNFSSWYNKTEGTMFSNVKFGINLTLNNFESNSIVFAISDDTISNRITLFGLSGVNSVVTRYRAITGITYSNIASINSSQNKFTFSFAKEKSVLSSNSTLYNSLSSANVTYPIVDKLDIGNQNKEFYLTGTISRLTYYPKRLPNSQLQALTR